MWLAKEAWKFLRKSRIGHPGIFYLNSIVHKCVKFLPTLVVKKVNFAGTKVHPVVVCRFGKI